MAEHEGSIAFCLELTNRTYVMQEYLEEIDKYISELDLKDRKIDLKNPDIVLKFIEVYKYGDKGEPLKAYFATEVLKNPSLYTKFSLSDRVYLGPTTTDHELAILMANQALVTNKTMVYDPFCGTCGILLICSYFG